MAYKENCGVIRYNGAFSDRSCNLKYNFICKKPQAYGKVPNFIALVFAGGGGCLFVFVGFLLLFFS